MENDKTPTEIVADLNARYGTDLTIEDMRLIDGSWTIDGMVPEQWADAMYLTDADTDDIVDTLDRLGAVWSPDLDAYAAGQIDAAAIRCVLCGQAPCKCAPFGSPEYLAAVDRLHGTNFAG